MVEKFSVNNYVNKKNKFNIKLIKDYIEGNDIKNYTIEELEDNIDFMYHVMWYTNDKNIYNLCSENLKNNYEFIKKIIYLFRDDIEFIHKIAQDFIEKTSDQTDRLELIIIMSELTKNKNRDYNTKYRLMALSVYSRQIIKIELLKISEEGNEDFLYELGEGFALMDYYFGKSKLAMNFFAEKLINNILITDNNFDLEKTIHKHFDNLEKIEKYGLNKYIIELIDLFDRNLSEYATCHLEVLTNIKKQIQEIKNNWDIFLWINNEQRYDSIITQIHEYIEDNEKECTFSELEILFYISKELGILDEIKEHNYYIDLYYDELINNITIDKEKMTLMDFKHYYNIKKIIQKLLKTNIYDNHEEGVEIKLKEHKKLSKILELD